MQYQIGVEVMDILHYIRIHISLFFSPLSTHRFIVRRRRRRFLSFFFLLLLLLLLPLSLSRRSGELNVFFSFDFSFLFNPLVLSRISFD